MKKKYVNLITLLLMIFLVGCQEDTDQGPLSAITPELAQNSEKDSFLNRIDDLLSSSEVKNQIAEPLGDVYFEDASYFRSDFEENVAFLPVYTESSQKTEAIIVATQSNNGIRLGILVRGHLRRLTPPTDNDNAPSLSMLAQLFVILDNRIFGSSTSDLPDIIGAMEDNSDAIGQSVLTDGSNTNGPMEWHQVQDGVICVDTFKEGDPEGVLECWPDYHWEWSPSDPIIIDGGSGGGSGGTYIPTTDPKKPCVGNAIKNPEIAPQKWSKIKGARFGEAARKEYNEDRTALIDKAHDGLDIKNAFGDPVYSMFDGTVDEIGFNEGGWGKWMIVKSTVNGKTTFVLYAHLDSYGKAKGSSITAGTILGKAGDTGNLANGIAAGTALQHLHIETREGANWSSAAKKNPEEYVTTKFDSNGKAIESTKC